MGDMDIKQPGAETTRTSGEAASARESLIEKASRFLDDEEIRKASNEQKVEFLRTKGLTDDEIQRLAQAKLSDTQDASKGLENQAQESIDSQQTSSTDTNQSDNATSPTRQSNQSPPIITYPEFLFRSQKPAPLVTKERLLQAFYLASGAAATMYGVNNYVVQPMLESLSSARQTFFENVSSNTDNLNEKLQGIVSRLPESQNDNTTERVSDDADSSALDPAHFFSRSAATQTSPRLSRSSSTSSIPQVAAAAAPTAVTVQSTNLSKLQALLKSLRLDDYDELEDLSDPLTHNVEGLTDDLKSLPACGTTGQVKKNRLNVVETDGVAKVKSEIKGVKGALLSAKNFPSRAPPVR